MGRALRLKDRPQRASGNARDAPKAGAGFRGIAIAAAAAVLLNTGCAANFPYQAQSLPSVPEKSVVLKAKAKSEKEFVEYLEKTGHSNIHINRGVGPGGELYSVVCADYLGHAYVFKDGEPFAQVKIKHDAEHPPVYPFAKIVLGNGDAGVFVTSPYGMVDGKPNAQIVLFDEEGGEKLRATIDLTRILKKHRDMYDPYLGGSSLKDGLFFCARDDGMRPWGKVYLIRLVDGEFKVTGVPQSAAMKCSCFTDWLAQKH